MTDYFKQKKVIESLKILEQEECEVYGNAYMCQQYVWIYKVIYRYLVSVNQKPCHQTKMFIFHPKNVSIETISCVVKTTNVSLKKCKVILIGVIFFTLYIETRHCVTKKVIIMAKHRDDNVIASCCPNHLFVHAKISINKTKF